jgi:hypothetical protein
MPLLTKPGLNHWHIFTPDIPNHHLPRIQPANYHIVGERVETARSQFGRGIEFEFYLRVRFYGPEVERGRS